MSKDSTPDLSSLLFARAPLALSHTQRLVSTWLPPPTPEELARAQNPAEIQREQNEIFTPTTELSGLGAKLTAEDEKEAMTVRSDERLKIQLLGKDWKKAKRNDAGKPTSSLEKAKRLPPRQAEPELSSEEETGRTSIGKAKARVAGSVLAEDHNEETFKDGSELALTAPIPKPSRKKKAANYLDEVLAEKAWKRARKKK